jgi:hypothetical protein
MKTFNIHSLLVLILLTAVQPIWAQDLNSSSSLSVSDDYKFFQPGPLDIHLNPQLGVSSFEYSGSGAGVQERLAGGATVEFGSDARKLETGLLYLQSSANATLADGNVTRINSSYMAIPMMAKLRVVNLKSQSWYAKFGVISAIQTGSSDRVDTNAFDILAAAGVGARFPFTSKADFIVEATYNRGFMNAFDTNQPGNFNQGVLVMAGLSFRL